MEKGEFCTTDADCPTTDKQVFAACKCGFSDTGSKFCDIEGGDDEWVAATEAFALYVETSLNCHSAEGWGECHENEYFLDWKCKEYKA